MVFVHELFLTSAMFLADSNYVLIVVSSRTTRALLTFRVVQNILHTSLS